jgi:macrolide-specific efflux system membrane fusion protein
MQDTAADSSRAGPGGADAKPRQQDREPSFPFESGTVPSRARRSRFRRFRWWAVALVVAALAGWYVLAGRDTAPAAKPLTVRVEVGDIENAVTAAGTLQPSEYVDVGAQVSGQLEKLYVEVGDAVKAGDLVAEIDATVQINRVEASRANLAALQAQLSARESAVTLAKARLERQVTMMEEDATSQDDYDDAVNQLASAQASLTQLRSQIEQAKASLGSDEATLGYSRIYAPMDGTVVSIAMKEGQTLNAVQMAPTILRIADLSTMTVEAEVSEADVSKLTRGMPVYFTTLGSGERRWTGTLRQILPTPVVENNVVLYTALFDVDNSDGALLTEMTAQVFFVTASAHDVLKVPVAAVSYTDSTGRAGGRPREPSRGGPREHAPAEPQAGAGAPPSDAASGRAATVRVMKADGSIETRSIRVGLTSRISAQVLSGLEEGDEVVAGIVDSPQAGQQRGRPLGPF